MMISCVSELPFYPLTRLVWALSWSMFNVKVLLFVVVVVVVVGGGGGGGRAAVVAAEASFAKDIALDQRLGFWSKMWFDPLVAWKTTFDYPLLDQWPKLRMKDNDRWTTHFLFREAVNLTLFQFSWFDLVNSLLSKDAREWKYILSWNARNAIPAIPEQLVSPTT